MDFKTELELLNKMKLDTKATDQERINQAQKVADAFNLYSEKITPKGKKVKRLPANHFLQRYIPS